MSTDWLGEKRTEVAGEAILDAAGRLFVAHGPTGVGMNDIAEAAGCSRATLYRYFDNRRALQSAFVNREARRLADVIHLRTREIADSSERLFTAVTFALELVRADPSLAAWFVAGDTDLAVQLASSSEVVDAFSVAFFADMGGDERDRARRARWTVRCILSLLTIPDGDEHALVREFVVPVLLPRESASAVAD